MGEKLCVPKISGEILLSNKDRQHHVLLLFYPFIYPSTFYMQKNLLKDPHLSNYNMKQNLNNSTASIGCLLVTDWPAEGLHNS